MTEFYIDTQEQLLTFCESIKDSQWLALDTEFLREKTYYPKFCLLQISNGQISACVDPLRLDDLSPIKNILFNTNIVKVLHAAHQDLEIFHLLWDKIPAPIFDTQLAAAITGYGDQMGYARLVSQLLNVTLEKDQARTDWSKRPRPIRRAASSHVGMASRARRSSVTISSARSAICTLRC